MRRFFRDLGQTFLKVSTFLVVIAFGFISPSVVGEEFNCRFGQLSGGQSSHVDGDVTPDDNSHRSIDLSRLAEANDYVQTTSGSSSNGGATVQWTGLSEEDFRNIVQQGLGFSSPDIELIPTESGSDVYIAAKLTDVDGATVYVAFNFESEKKEFLYSDGVNIVVPSQSLGLIFKNIEDGVRIDDFGGEILLDGQDAFITYPIALISLLSDIQLPLYEFKNSCLVLPDVYAVLSGVVSVKGAETPDRFDFSSLEELDEISISIDGGAGIDSIWGPDLVHNATWEMIGQEGVLNAGAGDIKVGFTNIENIIGGEAQDRFVIAPNESNFINSFSRVETVEVITGNSPGSLQTSQDNCAIGSIDGDAMLMPKQPDLSGSTSTCSSWIISIDSTAQVHFSSLTQNISNDGILFENRDGDAIGIPVAGEPGENTLTPITAPDFSVGDGDEGASDGVGDMGNPVNGPSNGAQSGGGGTGVLFLLALAGLTLRFCNKTKSVF